MQREPEKPEDHSEDHEDHNATELLIAWGNGDQDALDQLAPLVQKELHRLARFYMSRERPNHTLQPTELINEAYVRLIKWRPADGLRNRAHFIGIAAQLMRNILVDHAIQKNQQGIQVSLPEVDNEPQEVWVEIIALNDALTALRKLDPLGLKLVGLRYFGGFTMNEMAEVAEVLDNKRLRTLERKWEFIKAWLDCELDKKKEKLIEQDKNKIEQEVKVEQEEKRMTPEQWQRLEQLFHKARKLPPEERDAFIERSCADDEVLRRKLVAMIAVKPKANCSFPVRSIVEDKETVKIQLAAGQRLDHYEVLNHLGSGAMGEVWLADDTKLPRKVAIKLLPARFTSDAERVRRFELEARAVLALNHPNIITLYEIGAVEGIRYIVTEYVKGETVRQRMVDAPQGRMKALEAIDIAVQVAAALVATHEAGIIHRDIKPENVMVRPDGIVKVLDFGIAKLKPQAAQGSVVADASTEAGAKIGTPRYMSPEQAGGKEVDVCTDIFSLGVVLYEMVAGCPPFVGTNRNEIIAAILRDSPLPLTRHAPDAPPELARIIGQALCKERAARYQKARDLLADLEELKQQLKLEKKIGMPRLALPPEVVMTNKDLILLADFENKTDDPIFDGALKRGLAIQLRQSPFLSLFPEERVRHTLRLMRRSSEERVTSGIAREICRRNNLKALIAGSIATLGSHYVITLETIAFEGLSGWTTIATEQVEARSKERVLHVLSQAASRLRAKLGESLSSIQQFDREMEETTTEKLEAFQAYSLGYEQTLCGRLADAIQLYRRAAELDPDFSYAWSMLAIHHSASGRPGLAADYAEKAYALKDRVSDYEQLQVTFRYHFNFTGDLHKALNAAVVFKHIYPRTSTAPIDLLVTYDLIGQHDHAVAEGREAVSLNPNFAPAYFYLGRSLLRVNRFAEAKDIFQQALDQKFDLTNIHGALYLIAFLEGDTTGMQRQIDWTRGKPDEFVALDWQAGAAACMGQWRKAQEFARRAIDLAGRGDMKELAARYATEQALRGAVLEDCQRAKADAAQGLKIAVGRASMPRAALALALCGEAQQVRQLIDELSQRYPEDTVINSIWLPTIRAALELQAGNAAQALDQLQTTTSYQAAAEFWPQYLRGQAYLKLGRGAESMLEFQSILDHRGQAPLSPLYPLTYLGLARAAALTDDLVKSRKAYEDFFAVWKEADADLAILRAAKREFEI